MVVTHWLLNRQLTCRVGITSEIETKAEDKLYERRNDTHHRSGGLVGVELTA